MNDALRLAAGLALPWLAGFAVVRALLARYAVRDNGVAIGYGHFAGVLLVTLLLRAFDRAGLGLALLPTALTLIVIAGSALFFTRRIPVAPADAASTMAAPPAWQRWLAFAAFALIAIKAGTLAIDVVYRPLFAWDAWSQWGTKAKAWSGLGAMVPFVDFSTWLARDGIAYTDTAAHYPATVPLLQTWMTLMLGRWDDSMMNVPWLAGFVALAIGMYAQLRRLGVDQAPAAIAAYVATSAPLLGVHVALAGYADFHTAAVYALAVLALAEWETTRARSALVLLVVPAALLPLLKVPGIAWLGTIAIGFVVATWGTTRMRIVAGAALVLAATTAIALLMGQGRVIVAPAAEQQRIVESLARHLFAFGSWNLVWYLIPLAIIIAWREVLRSKAVAITLACGFGFLVWTFFFTRAGDWVVDYTTVNRALLHIMPAAVAFAALVLDRAARYPVPAAARTPAATPPTNRVVNP